jgi:hypothetical protein
MMKISSTSILLSLGLVFAQSNHVFVSSFILDGPKTLTFVNIAAQRSISQLYLSDDYLSKLRSDPGIPTDDGRAVCYFFNLCCSSPQKMNDEFSIF